MPLQSYPNLIFKVTSIPRITCLTCGDEMPLDYIESVNKDYDLRTISCPKCDIIECFVFDITPPESLRA